MELLTILPSARHIITSKTEDVLACWDIQTGERIAAWNFGQWDRVVQCRPVDKGAACMLVVQVIDDHGHFQFELLRLQFSLDDAGKTTGQFYSQLKFTAPHQQIADMSLSEDVITILTVTEGQAASVTFLNWRNRSFISGQTAITIPENWNMAAPVFTLLSPNSFNVILDDTVRPTIHTFDNSLLYPTLHTALGVNVLLPEVQEREMKFENNTDKFLSWEPHSSLAHRKWDSSLRGNMPHLARSLSDFRTFEHEGHIVLAHSMLPLPYDDAAQARTFYEPFEVHSNFDASEQRPSLVIAESKYALYIERGHDQCYLRACEFPPEELRERKESPEWYTRHLVRTLHVPDGLDLRLACDLALNEAYGIVVISLSDGTIWVLQY
ncbi:hypothetical protein AURDEDRAFT_144529 [Auricularia subglabra TFB-10046 SS5]|nr:hypothetical protein AURDEDRAFT_144529 [Auricularia subglabra TFB-10046 SS5]